MLTTLIMGILAGLDNLQITSAIGLMGIQPNRKWRVVAAFVFFEMTMPLLGLLIGNQLNTSFQIIAHWLGPCMMATLGIYIIMREFMEKEKQDIISKKWVIVLLPFLMSLDNLIAGVGLGTAGFPVISSSLIVGICAAGMCFLGLLLGEKLRRLIPEKIEIISGIYLIVMAVFLAVK
jgi:manganese efflux pump family protein